MIKLRTENRILIIDSIGMAGIGGYVFFCSLFGSNFSEIHIQLGGLDFPIFLGEILLFALFFLYLIKMEITKEWKPYHSAWTVGIVCTLVASAVGYVYWGPLALRHAAVFYYVLLALLSYSFFNMRILNNQIVKTILGVVFFAIVAFEVNECYFWYTLTVLMVVMILKGLNSPQRYFIIFIALIFSHLENIIVGSRAHLIGVGGAVLFLIIFNISFIKNWPRAVRFVCISFILLVFIGGMLKFSDKNAVISLMDWSQIRILYEQNKQYIKDNKGGVRFAARRYALYHPNKDQSQISLLDNSSTKEEYVQSSNYKPLPSVLRISEAVSAKKEGHVQISNYKQPPSALSIPKAESSKNMGSSDPSDRISNQAAKQVLISENSRPMKQPESSSVVKNELISSAFKESVLDKNEQDSSMGDTQLKVKEDDLSIPLEIDRNLDVAFNNILFRVFIWEDMFKELWETKFMGVGLGKPQRSASIETLGWAYAEWARDGWISAHNFYFSVIYRVGIIGIILLVLFVAILISLITAFVRKRDECGLLLMSIIIYWCLQSSFSVTLELPHYAIPFWSLLGIIFAYAFPKEKYDRR